MGRLVGKRQYRELLLALGLLCAALALVLWPGEAMGAMRDGLKLCGNVIVPSCFPSSSSPPWWWSWGCPGTWGDCFSR